jgi:hypothetical protein
MTRQLSGTIGRIVGMASRIETDPVSVGKNEELFVLLYHLVAPIKAKMLRGHENRLSLLILTVV